jgi:hypothetical protein
MKSYFEGSVGQFTDNLIIVLAAISLLFPSSALVLCISPAGHVEIEDLNAACCAHNDISSPGKNQPDNRCAAAADCHNCTDLFLTPNGRGAVTESYDIVPAGSRGDECVGNHLLADVSFWLNRQDAIQHTDRPIPVSSSVPLRF